MSEVVATAEHVVRAPAERVKAALADYEGARRRAMPEQFSDYRVESGGTGAGTRVHWLFAATSKRVRDQLVEVAEPDADTLVERDANSSLVTTWTVRPADTGVSTVRARTTWNGGRRHRWLLRAHLRPEGPAARARRPAHPARARAGLTSGH